MAKKMMDIALRDSEDLEITEGDFVVEESTHQHQRQLLLNGKGDFKENPTICVDVFNFLDGEGGVARETAIEFTRDGMDFKNEAPNTNSIQDGKAKIYDSSVYK